MIIDKAEQYVISSVGWVEGSSFTRLELASGKTQLFHSDSNGGCRALDIDGDRFLLVTHPSGSDPLSMSVRRYAEPAESLWSVRGVLDDYVVRGDPSAVVGARRRHLFWTGQRHVLVTLSEDGSGLLCGQLPWFDDSTFDLGYQSPVDAVDDPVSGYTLVSIQRCSDVFVHDPGTSTLRGRFRLPGACGNPRLQVIGNELWTVDYHTFARIDLRDHRLLASARLSATNEFVGDVFRWTSRGRALVPRPFMGDITVVNPDTGSIEQTLATRGQPLSCAATADGRVVARDWKSGEWVFAQISMVPTQKS